MTASAPSQPQASGLSLWAGVLVALAVSLGVLWYITKEPLVVAGFGAAVVLALWGAGPAT